MVEEGGAAKKIQGREGDMEFGYRNGRGNYIKLDLGLYMGVSCKYLSIFFFSHYVHRFDILQLHPPIFTIRFFFFYFM